MPLTPFTASDPYTLGIELELQVVTPPGWDLSQDSSLLIDEISGQISAGEVKHDITESMLEIATGVCKDIHQASSQFSALQQVILAAAGRHHLAVCGGGTHPYQKWQRQEICKSERYTRTLESFGYLMQQATVFGQHVHIGCRNGDDAIYLMHGLSRFVPHVIALCASSPWIQGTDTQFSSSRLNIFSAFPDNGPAPFVENWQQFESMYQHLERSRIIESIKDLHWDIRPSPSFGTVEVRVMDTPLSLSRAVNVAGFLQVLANWLLEERPFTPMRDDYLLYRFNRFQACRYGLKGTLSDVRTDAHCSIAEDILHHLPKLAPYAQKLNAESALHDIEQIVRTDHSDAKLMREFIANGGVLSEMVKRMTEIWAAPL